MVFLQIEFNPWRYGAEEKLVDLQKRFLIYPMYPKYLAAPQFIVAIRMKASTPFRYSMKRERHLSTRNMGISTAHRLCILKILGIIHRINFILQFLKSSR